MDDEGIGHPQQMRRGPGELPVPERAHLGPVSAQDAVQQRLVAPQPREIAAGERRRAGRHPLGNPRRRVGHHHARVEIGGGRPAHRLELGRELAGIAPLPVVAHGRDHMARHVGRHQPGRIGRQRRVDNHVGIHDKDAAIEPGKRPRREHVHIGRERAAGVAGQRSGKVGVHRAEGGDPRGRERRGQVDPLRRSDQHVEAAVGQGGKLERRDRRIRQVGRVAGKDHGAVVARRKAGREVGVGGCGHRRLPDRIAACVRRGMAGRIPTRLAPKARGPQGHVPRGGGI